MVEEVEYTELLKALDDHFGESLVVFAERYSFWTLNNSEDETLKEGTPRIKSFPVDSETS